MLAGDETAGIEDSDEGNDGDRRLSPTFHANRCSLGAWAGSIRNPNLRTKAAPEFACIEVNSAEPPGWQGEAWVVLPAGAGFGIGLE